MVGSEGSLGVVGGQGEVGLGLGRGQGEGSLGMVRGLGVRISEWGEGGLEVGVCGVGGQG